MKRFFLDYNERQIVHAAVRLDSRRGKSSPFSKKAADAIRKAKDELDVWDISPDVRDVIVEKIFCYRGQFYQYRKQFCFLVADNMGLIDARRRKQSGRGG